MADGTFEGLRFQVSNAISANAAASLASEGSPNSSEARIVIFKGRSSFASMASKVGLLVPPPRKIVPPPVGSVVAPVGAACWIEA